MHGRKYTERVVNHLVPCLGQLAVATHDDILWKSLNYQVLLKTKHTEKEVSNFPDWKPTTFKVNSSTSTFIHRSTFGFQVRLASLAMLNELQQKLGEAYSTLLPETVPFLAELMEGKLVLCNLFYINNFSDFPSIL